MQLFALVIIAIIIEVGCAVQYIDRDGVRHIWGLTHTTIREIRHDRSEVVAQQVAAIGVSVLLLPEHGGVSVGYTRNFSIRISSRDEGGEIIFPMSTPTNFAFKELTTIIEEIQCKQ